MRPSYARVHALELLDQHGQLTVRELVELEPSLSLNVLGNLVLKWLTQGLVSRRRAYDHVLLTYRYEITDAGRAVLSTDRVVRESEAFQRVGSLKTIEVDGERLTITEAAAARGLKPKTLRTRLERGMSVEDALKPPRKAGARSR